MMAVRLKFLKIYRKQFKYNAFETEHRILEFDTFIQLSHFKMDKVLSYEVNNQNNYILWIIGEVT